MLVHEPVTGRTIDSDDFEAKLEAAIRDSASMPPLRTASRPTPRLLPLHERLAAAQAARLCKVATKPEAAETPQPLTAKGVEADRARDCLVRPSHRPSDPHSTPSSTPVSLKPTRKPWSRAKIPARDRFGYGVDVAARNGGRAFSLNLSAARERSILRSADPTRTLSTYINRALKKNLGRPIPYSFAFEFSPEGRLHVHGAYIPVDQSKEHAQAVKAVFREAGGKIKGRAGSRQMDTDQIHDASGWFRYTLKTHRRTVTSLGTDKVTFISKNLRNLARDQYNSIITPV